MPKVTWVVCHLTLGPVFLLPLKVRLQICEVKMQGGGKEATPLPLLWLLTIFVLLGPRILVRESKPDLDPGPAQR